MPEGGVRKIIDNAVEKNQFGAFLEQAKTQVGTMGRFSSLLDEATTGMQTDEGGMITSIKNPVAASVVLMQLARMAQGVGVLSNQDVNLIRGGQTLEQSYQRTIEKYLGNTITLTKDMMDSNPVWGATQNPDTGKTFEVGDEVLMGGANLSAADLGMFKQIATRMDNRFKQMVDVSIPQIYEEVRGIYGGLQLRKYIVSLILIFFTLMGLRQLKEGQQNLMECLKIIFKVQSGHLIQDLVAKHWRKSYA